MIRAYELTKRYGDSTVVQDLDFTVLPSTVTGLLGPNGAGRSTTMRMLLGLDAPTRGRSAIGGPSYAAHSAPLTVQRGVNAEKPRATRARGFPVKGVRRRPTLPQGPPCS
ncbi:ATP-binding cassette domain-containing protein, partial [Streptomyces sp. NPDC056831]|uniref:ATP-binding cassette domain-containing protein n=1 Tax=Streptomyces sp. NPDC056831 TaxID=3345954 RepID=UPI0036AD62CA